MEEKIPAIKLMHEGSDGHLILLKWPAGIKEEAVMLLRPLSSSCPRVHQRESGSNLSLFSLFWDVTQLGIQSICLHYLICLLKGSLYHLLRLYMSSLTYMILITRPHIRCLPSHSVQNSGGTDNLPFLYRVKSIWKADYQLSGKWWSLQAIKMGLFAFCR